MATPQKIALFLLRLTIGWLFLYAGITKILDPHWSAAGYIGAAKTFPALYQLFLAPKVLPLVNILNAWGLALLGVSLISGFFVRLSAIFGILLMALYYFAILQFPHPNPQAYIVDEHIIIIAGLMILGVFNAGRVWSLGNKFR